MLQYNWYIPPCLGKLDHDVKGGTGTNEEELYSETKFIQLLNAHYWRRQLNGSCDVVAVSPGLIPGTGMLRHSNLRITMDMPDAKPISVGESNLITPLFSEAMFCKLICCKGLPAFCVRSLVMTSLKIRIRFSWLVGVNGGAGMCMLWRLIKHYRISGPRAKKRLKRRKAYDCYPLKWILRSKWASIEGAVACKRAEGRASGERWNKRSLEYCFVLPYTLHL